ncbi:hypothetical protein [Nitrospirillum iridis]|uniref:Uncharacterized protein n=1 Tax=Nitrospirillum iridis TaxID=765888 RepID=A0A7X0B018_9PROT|nr:hypothetical protein [Nitrospirillum iridis]MBB6253282.1 hypothetical protein [Nitrospirillum iridis]
MMRANSILPGLLALVTSFSISALVMPPLLDRAGLDGAGLAGAGSWARHAAHRAGLVVATNFQVGIDHSPYADLRLSGERR